MSATENPNEKLGFSEILGVIKFEILQSSSFLAKNQTNPNQLFTSETQTPKYYLQPQSLFYKTFHGQKKNLCKSTAVKNTLKHKIVFLRLKKFQHQKQEKVQF